MGGLFFGPFEEGHAGGAVFVAHRHGLAAEEVRLDGVALGLQFADLGVDFVERLVEAFERGHVRGLLEGVEVCAELFDRVGGRVAGGQGGGEEESRGEPSGR